MCKIVKTRKINYFTCASKRFNKLNLGRIRVLLNCLLLFLYLIYRIFTLGAYYRLQRSCGKVMFLHTSLILSMGGLAGRHTPWQADTPRQADTPLPSACYDTVNKWVVCIPMECILVKT